MWMSFIMGVRGFRNLIAYISIKMVSYFRWSVRNLLMSLRKGQEAGFVFRKNMTNDFGFMKQRTGKKSS